jgi:hypothetical protein
LNQEDEWRKKRRVQLEEQEEYSWGGAVLTWQAFIGSHNNETAYTSKSQKFPRGANVAGANWIWKQKK